jgi:two-component system, OmpR family, alkaline phosphatase synthesis response regulator PhoP
MKILLAEDEPDIQFVIQIALEDAGHQIFVVGDGLAAIERARAEQFDVVLLDVMMPRLDGLGTCQQLKADARTWAIPVIFLTARSQQAEVQAGLLIGALGYIVKPFDAFTLADEIDRLLAKPAEHERPEADRL